MSVDVTDERNTQTERERKKERKKTITNFYRTQQQQQHFNVCQCLACSIFCCF